MNSGKSVTLDKNRHNMVVQSSMLLLLTLQLFLTEYHTFSSIQPRSEPRRKSIPSKILISAYLSLYCLRRKAGND
jgi:hypothetical protein